MLEEPSCTILTSSHVPKLRYRADALNIDPSPTFHKLTQA